MSRISTHVLDTSRGKPAAGVMVHLFCRDRGIASAQTDSDGRCANLLPPGVALESAVYKLVFETAGYFPDGFYPEVSISFRADSNSSHYHVPLLLSPFGYTTYRGS